MTKHRLITVSALVLGAALALSGCAGDSQDPSTDDTSTPNTEASFVPEVNPLEVIQLRGTAAVPVTYAAYYGPAESQGLDLSITWVESAAVSVSAVISGSVPIGQTSYATLIDAVNQGIDLVIISEAHSLLPGNLLLQTLPDSGIQDLQDLQGKRVGVSVLNGSVHYKLVYALEQEGIDPSTVEFVVIPTGEVGAALEQGNLDAATASGVYLQELQEELGTVTVFDLAAGSFEGLPEIAWYTTREFASTNPQTIAAFQCAIIDAADALQEREPFETVLVEHFDNTPEEAARQDMFDFRGGVRVDVLQRNADFMLEAGRIAEEFDIETVVVPAPEECP